LGNFGLKTLTQPISETTLTGLPVCHHKSLIPVHQTICATRATPFAMIYAIQCPVLLLPLWFISVFFFVAKAGPWIMRTII